MHDYIHQLGQFIEANQFWAGPITFLLTMGESLLIIGILIPATALLLFTGGLVGTGTLPVTPVLLWGIAGAIVGDAISFFIGRWVGPKILRWKAIKRHRSFVARARLFFYRHGFVSIFFGRFLGPLRSSVPTVAGAMGMSVWRFQLANCLSALTWVPLLLLPGYLAAKSLVAAHHAGNLMLYIAVILCLVVGVFFYFQLKKSSSANQRRARRRENTIKKTESLNREK